MGSTFIKKIQKLFFKYLIWLILLASGSILTYMLIDMSDTITSLAKDAIIKTTERTRSELDNFFDPIINTLNISKEWGESDKYTICEIESLNQQFVPIIENSIPVSSMLIANTNGCEYMLLEMGDSNWINRSTRWDSITKQVIKYEWKAEDNYLKKTLEEEWTEKKDYDPRVRPWFINAIENKHENKPAWTEPYIFATTKDPGITISIKWQDNIDTSVFNVVAYDIMLTDISKYTSKLDVSENGKAFILTKNNKLIGLPKNKKFESVDSLKSSVLMTPEELNMPEIIKAVETGIEYNIDEPFDFNCDNFHWWGILEKYYLSPDEYLLIGVIAPEKDFVSEIKQTRNTIIIGFGLVIILTVVMVYSFQQKRKNNILLTQQNEEIRQAKEEIEAQRDEIESQRDEIEAQRDQVLEQKEKIELQNHEITDSIHYAKRIQSAILPVDEFRNKYLPEHFILFKPKDIVSGDFYWMTHIEGRVVIAAADCTGHGVPGAFMSMLGAAFLNDIVNKEYMTHPSIILRKLRKEIVRALKQTGATGEQKDGMDIALISVDFEKNEVQFAGANNPLYVIRGIDMPGFENIEDIKILETESHRLYEIKADKMPIAIYEKMDKFNTYELKLDKGDALFMFSDGYADQFGGPNGKKLKYKPFKQILLDSINSPMDELCTKLDTTFEDWKAFPDENGRPHEQVDDVVVIGIKL